MDKKVFDLFLVLMLRNLGHFSTATNDAKKLNANINVTNAICYEMVLSGRFRMFFFLHCNKDILINVRKRA